MALEGILSDNHSVDKAENQPILNSTQNYKEILERYKKACQEFGQKNKSGAYAGTLEEYLDEMSVQNPRSANLSAARNFFLISSELAERKANGSKVSLIALDISDLERSLSELMESIENTELIKDIYRKRKQTTKEDGGISTSEAAKIKHFFYQGRELYKSGSNGSLLVKPLNYFYSVTAYTCGVIILNSPIRYRKDMLPGSHGINYLPDSLQVQFGGDMPRGTFSDLHTSFPENLIRSFELEIIGSNLDSVVSFYKHRCTSGLGTLLSLVPEMAEFYKLATGRDSRVHRLVIRPSSEIRDTSINFRIGDGIRRPSLEDLKRDFPVGSKIFEEGGALIVVVSRQNVDDVSASIYTDINGRLWYIDNPFYPIRLPEICLHFLILAIFSNIMRYRPDEWGGLVDNDVSVGVSLAVRHYFSVLERKFNTLILRSASLFFPFAPEASIWF